MEIYKLVSEEIEANEIMFGVITPGHIYDQYEFIQEVNSRAVGFEINQENAIITYGYIDEDWYIYETEEEIENVDENCKLLPVTVMYFQLLADLNVETGFQKGTIN